MPICSSNSCCHATIAYCLSSNYNIVKDSNINSCGILLYSMVLFVSLILLWYEDMCWSCTPGISQLFIYRSSLFNKQLYYGISVVSFILELGDKHLIKLSLNVCFLWCANILKSVHSHQHVWDLFLIVSREICGCMQDR